MNGFVAYLIYNVPHKNTTIMRKQGNKIPQKTHNSPKVELTGTEQRKFLAKKSETNYLKCLKRLGMTTLV